ncbi:hypothetical protein Tco_0681616 [Tanacetum coccineum]|uniref:Uncharacterized protein n=1 Tax=Tanacetum coccineum TaxID=301880 RepID=A0ABQ4XNV6_9ASTR
MVSFVEEDDDDNGEEQEEKEEEEKDDDDDANEKEEQEDGCEVVVADGGCGFLALRWHLEEIHSVETASLSDGVKNLATALGRGKLKEDLESST